MRILRVLGILLVLLLVCCLASVVVVVLQSNSALNETYDIADEAVAVSDDPEVIARGQYLVDAVALCSDCHGEDLGGDEFIDDPFLGTIHAPNLTAGQGGAGETFTDADYERAIRHGVDEEGKPLIIMPAGDYQHLTNQDLGAVISYVRSLPPVDQSFDDPSLNAGRLFIMMDKELLLPAAGIDHDAEAAESIAIGVTPEYGEYLALIACQGCHGEDYAGQSFPDGRTPSANLTPAGALGDYTEDQFLQVLKTGVKPSGDVIDSDDMPWNSFAHMTEDDMSALWVFLQTVTPVESEG